MFHMNKIILKSLELAGFKNASDIALIIAATPNPTVATEMLLGVYQPKTIAELGEYWKGSYSDTMYAVSKIDELNDVVTCHKYSPKIDLFYYLTESDYDNKTNRVHLNDKDKSVKYYDYRQETVPGISIGTDTFKMRQFNDSLKQITELEFMTAYQKWDPETTLPEPPAVIVLEDEEVVLH